VGAGLSVVSKVILIEQEVNVGAGVLVPPTAINVARGLGPAFGAANRRRDLRRVAVAPAARRVRDTYPDEVTR